MFLHINHSQDQIIAMRYLTREILESKIKSLSDLMTSETEHDIKKKISKYELFIKKTKDIDNNDFMVFDYLKYAIGENQYFQSIFIDNKKYAWITRSKFISDLPTLNIKSKNNVTGRLSKYIDMGILEKHTIKGKVSKVYFSFTDLASKILGKTLEDREFVRDILVKNGFINKNKSPQKIIEENPQPPKQPAEQKEKKTKYSKKEQEFRDMLERVQQKVKRKAKANFTKKALELFKQSGLNLDEVERNFIAHINQKEQFAKTIANFLLEYEACVEDLFSNTSSSQNQRNNKPETYIEMRERELAEKIARLQSQDDTSQDIFEAEIIGE